MGLLIDRRLNSRNRNAVNRQRFLQRYRKHVRKAVEAAVNKRSITDVERGERVAIPADDVGEPQFVHGGGGERASVHPGNREFVAGDRVQRPQGGSGRGGGPSNDGEGEDDFVFQLTKEEVLDVVFDGLELPNLIKRQLRGDEVTKPVHAGFSTAGVPAAISVLRTVRAAKARRIALGGNARRQIRELEAEIAWESDHGATPELLERLRCALSKVRGRLLRLPFLDDVDVRYRLRVRQPQPVTQAVMFCLMDVSGSMDQHAKDLAKRFFLLLYLFLQRNYRHIEVVFIRHHTDAKEVDEQEFFHSRESGGTVVSSALKLMDEVVVARYPTDRWNIYGAQASDGDNWNDDSPLCAQLLANTLLPKLQYYAYVEIGRSEPQSLWREYEAVAAAAPAAFAQARITAASEIFAVFRGLFEKKQQVVPA